MSFLLDVADPSMHFRSRQYCNSAGSKVVETATPSPLSSSALTAVPGNSSSKHSLFPSALPTTAPTTTTTTSTSTTMSMPQIVMPKPTAISMPIPNGGGHNAFSAVSRMIRTASSSGASISPPSNLPSRSTTPFSSRPTTPDVTNVLDPFLTATLNANLTAAATTTTTTNNNSSSSNGGSRIATSLSPWMKPSVCDDDQMNKLVSFQL